MVCVFVSTSSAYRMHMDLYSIFFFSSRRRHTRSSTVSWLGDVYKRQVQAHAAHIGLVGDRFRIDLQHHGVAELVGPGDGLSLIHI